MLKKRFQKLILFYLTLSMIFFSFIISPAIVHAVYGLEWIEQLSASNWEVRKKAAFILGNIRAREAVDPLIQALKDPEGAVRAEAAEALGKIGEPKAVEPLLRILNDDDPEVRTAVIYALDDIPGRIPKRDATKPLMEALKDSEESVRRAAAYALGSMRSAEAAVTLIDALNDKASSVRAQAAESLGLIKDARAAEPLLALLKDTDTKVRVKATEALGNISSPIDIQPLILQLQDQQVSVRIASTKALCRSADKAGLEAIIAILDDPKIQKAASDAGCEFSDPKALQPLLTALKHEDIFVQSWAGFQLANIGEPAVSSLIEILKGKNQDLYLNTSVTKWNVRKNVIEALRQIGKPATPLLINMLQNQNEQERLAAAEALGLIKDPIAIPALLQAMTDSDISLRRTAVQALAGIRDQRVSALLDDAFKKGELNMIAWGHSYFVRRGEPGSENLLIEALNSEYGYSEMAQSFINSGNDKLKEAGYQWAKRHGYETHMLGGQIIDSPWGSDAQK